MNLRLNNVYINALGYNTKISFVLTMLIEFKKLKNKTCCKKKFLSTKSSDKDLVIYYGEEDLKKMTVKHLRKLGKKWTKCQGIPLSGIF